MSDSNPQNSSEEVSTDPKARTAAQGTDATNAAMRQELDEVVRQRDDYLEQLRRSQADFLNFQKRSRSQAEADRVYAAAPLANDLLAVMDNFERAIEAARQSGAEGIITGLDMVHKQLLDALAKHGVEPISAMGEAFDPNIHEALMQQPSAEHPEGTVVAELSRGYRLQDRVLRPSRVAVSVKPS
ncbi:nucleotide exchange factor GrpE [Tautonia rosea]|uniref:nucleotide exchange factor GrpE n=1 Tax=Tautonia rosea TaxID=2728037 RepID=UPI001475C01C|nr:nucleotide exchange factor GrpE [Tautonia rosea]